MMTWNYQFLFGNTWWLVPASFVAVIAWLLLSKQRHVIVAMLSLGLIVAVSLLWILDWRSFTSYSIAFSKFSGTVRFTKSLALISKKGGLELSFLDAVVDLGRIDPRPVGLSMHVQRFRTGNPGNLENYYPRLYEGGELFQRFGFGASIAGEPFTGTPVARHRWEMIIPNWFAIAILFCIFSRFLYKSSIGIKRLRRKRHLCEKCGYPLQGLPEPLVCPECGSRNQTRCEPESRR